MKIIKPVKMMPANIVSSTATDTEQPWDAEQTYAKGTRITYTGPQGPSIYQSAVADNTGNQPSTSPDQWVRVGPTQKWAPFDGSASTVSTSDEVFEVEISTDEIIDTLAFFEVTGSEIEVKLVIDATQEVVYQSIKPLQDDSMIVDWYTYFFSDFDLLRDGVVQGIPPYGAGKTLHVIVRGAGTVGVGEIVMGTIIDIGLTERDATHGIRDYSQVKEDAFGNVVMRRGGWSKKANMRVFVQKERHRYASRVLTDLRSIPTVFVGSFDPDYEPMVIFGFIKDWGGVISYPAKTLINIEIQGLK